MQEDDSLNNIILPILTYHELCATREDEVYCARTMGPSCAMGRDVFQKHLELIAANNVQTITFKNLPAVRNYDGNIHKVLILSFDDGHKGNYLHAYPLLAEKEMSAVFFVTTNLIDTNKMMNWSQLREMADNGMSIQSHGVSHEPFETLSPEKLEEELSQSKKIIEDKIGKEVDTISLPHGSMHRQTLEKARDVGYQFICTSIIDYFQFVGNATVMTAPRIPISNNMKFDIYSGIITGCCKDVHKWKRSQKIKYAIKRIVGINNYRRIYRLVHNINT